ncbi:YihY/virulence factor BrkB family protein [Nitrospira sp. Nam74]
MNPELAKIIGAKNTKATVSQTANAGSADAIKWNDVKKWWALLKEAAQKWSADKAPRLGAALSYYTVFSLVPLLVLSIAIAGLVFGKDAAQQAMMEQIESLVGPQSAAAIQQMLDIAQKPSSGVVATLVAIATLLLGASGVFAQLQDALNTVWGVEPKTSRGIWGTIKDRFFSLVAVLGTGFLLLVSLVLSAVLAAMGKMFASWLPGQEAVLHVADLGLSFGVITLLFAMMFKLLPDAKVAWRDVWIGAGLTSLLFTVGKFLIGLYLGKADVGSAYGAAGSLVILLVWMYYSSQILLFGAEFTSVYANRYGSHIVAGTNSAAA